MASIASSTLHLSQASTRRVTSVLDSHVDKRCSQKHNYVHKNVRWEHPPHFNAFVLQLFPLSKSLVHWLKYTVLVNLIVGKSFVPAFEREKFIVYLEKLL